MEIYKCKYCDKICKSIYSLKQHERLCKLNPNRIESPFISYNKSRKHAWNKGLTKEIDERVKKNGESIKKSYESGLIKSWCDGLTKETDERIRLLSQNISNTVNQKISNNDWHYGNMIGKKYEYKCIKFDSSWEIEFVKYLDSKNIIWERPKKGYKYIFEDTTHMYYPDIYLPEYDLFIEIKGKYNEKDIAKWEEFRKDKKLDIYFGDDLKNMGIIKNATINKNNRLYPIISKYRQKYIDL